MPSTEGRRILVADDDEAVRSALERVLRFNGYEVELAADGLETLDAIDRARPDAVVLDWMMPQLDGLGACRMLRGRGDDLPVLLLTARDQLGDRVAGLDAGADDYLAKPFELEELMARLRALLRRSRGFGEGPDGDGPEEILRFADLVMNVDTREVRRGDRVLHLTRTEFNLLEVLLRRPRRVLERTRIHEEVWGFDFGPSSNSLHVYIGYLRRKTEECGGPRLIHTVRGVGYSLREDPA
ncbi:response regulator transcription factor [Spirillospora sp. NPDC048911]|uniref:response regulator transcription factor n=1 Tax=Spirillospora sp. NPDC048911 TaxID=3364527 RepID=UPI0037212820